jgi:hypothetical protein
LSASERLERLLAQGDFFRVIKMNGKRSLFLEGILTFDELAVSEATPAMLRVGDDLGSYEVRSAGGLADRGAYQEFRAMVERHFGGERVGHQHLVHAWPKDASARAAIAPQYIELLDSTTWLLFWRQMKRDPDTVDSVLTHPYLGVYSREALDRLHEAMLRGDASKFKNKYRMIGARNVPGDPAVPAQQGMVLPDFELRSGNKGPLRAFLEDMIEARISSGDYSGLRDFRAHDFNASAPIDTLAKEWLQPEDLEILKRFEGSFPKMKFSDHSLALNHYRNRIISPLLPWSLRLDLGLKAEILKTEQEAYARSLVKIAKEYLQARSKVDSAGGLVSELYANTIEKLEKAIFDFANEVRLDQDFFRYLTPRPTTLPKLVVSSSGPIDVNQIALGLEYTFRFSVRAENSTQAKREIAATLEAFRESLGGGTIEELSQGGHGHGVSVRYEYTDPSQKVWRFEWDGISRDYVDGKVVNPRGGLLEVPTPKFNPRDAEEIRRLYVAARKTGKLPKRSAGGTHVNVDLAPIFELPPSEGTRRLIQLLVYFESNRELISFLWQHPNRLRAAIPATPKPELFSSLEKFSGGWQELAQLLYDFQYFNPYVGRKPRYMQMDLTGVLFPAVPDEFKKVNIDIKNPQVKWKPDFGNSAKERIEFRLFDAMEDEYLASLQIKYVRALLNATFNSSKKLDYRKPLEEQGRVWIEKPARFIEAAEAHLEELGLSPQEFRPLLLQSWAQRASDPKKGAVAGRVFDDF